ncbi:response regulator transcription factor [Chloroflexi bacterium]|jgi:DNA-binding response OmpR family regulator|nr:response regulator transcription factor [Chloroflexota bacterium]|tara:strand:+ start:1827 stop:2516 length:690 start_codon:yes stop_codon:yes gene_type:complete
MAKNILVVEDDKNVANLVTTYFENEKWNVKNAFDGEVALDIAYSESFDLVVLDLMLPKLSGIEFIKEYRNEYNTPVIMLTAKITESDIIKGLDLGADDYVTKPFSPKELVSRVKAIFRRIDKQNLFAKKKILSLKNMQIDVNLKKVLMNDVKVNLTPKEFSILQNLCSYPGKIYSRQEIIDLVFGLDFDGFDRTIDTHIANLRKKLKNADPENDYVESVYGLGYRLIDA